jgi:cob(I)alamin adenosyltransferase
MQADAVKLHKALMALLDNVDETCAAIRAVVTANLEEVDTTLLHIDNLAFDLGNLALECREAIVAEDEAKIDQDLVEDEAVAAEWDSLSTPSPPMTLEEHCEWWGMNYDSDQSRGIN